MVKKLSDHVKRQHTEKDVKKFVCELCGTRFKGQSGYQFHLAGKGRPKKMKTVNLNGYLLGESCFVSYEARTSRTVRLIVRFVIFDCVSNLRENFGQFRFFT